MDLIFDTQSGSSFSIEVGYFDNVLEIKEKVEKYQRIPVSKQTLVFQGNVLQDDHDIEQCDLYNNSRLQLFIKPDQSPQPNSTEQQIINCHQDSSVMTVGSSSSSSNNNEKKLRIMMVMRGGTWKIPVEVKEGDKVGELRKELAKIQQRFDLNLPEEGYFFIHKDNVMDDDKSFQCHRVDNGDTIEIFIGSVSGGS